MDMLSQMSGSLRSPACHRRALLTDSITEGASDIARLSVSPLFQKCWLSAYSQILPGQAERDRSGKIVSPVRGCLNRYLEKQTQQNGGGGGAVSTHGLPGCSALRICQISGRKWGRVLKSSSLLISVVCYTLLAEQGSLTGLCHWSSCWCACR